MKLKDYLNKYTEKVNKCISVVPTEQRFDVLNEAVICDHCPIYYDCQEYRIAQRYDGNYADCVQVLEKFIEIE